MVNIRAEFKRLWNQSPVLTFTSLLMLATFVASVAGIFLDPRIITGMPAWLKPAKFGISTTIYAATMAWLYRYITVSRRSMRVVAWIISVVFIVEIAIIDLQAARGVTSHFNNTSILNRVLFSIMGVSIVILLLSSVAIVVALFKQKFDNPAWGWALRLGMLTTVLGSALGGMMVAPTHDQMQAMREKQPVEAVGGHTVGGPDGGPGLPGVGWSTEHGDLRIPHFLGMHGVQLIPLFAWLFARRRVATVFIAHGQLHDLVAILVWQALKGESIVAPDGATLAVLAAWAGDHRRRAIGIVAPAGRAGGCSRVLKNMTPDKLFSICNPVALIGWLILVFAGRMKWAAALVTGAIIPLLFGILYASLIAMHWSESTGSFSTLEGVAALFQNHWLLLAGWIHYLAFDLFVGSWEVRDSAKNGISHWIVIPCLALTFMFGPIGLLAYFLVRLAKVRSLEIA